MSQKCIFNAELALMTNSTSHDLSELTGSVIDEETVYKNKTYLKTLGVEQVSGLSIVKIHTCTLYMYINISRGISISLKCVCV